MPENEFSTYQVCTKCKQNKTLSEYYMSSNKRTHRKMCKKCWSEASRKIHQHRHLPKPEPKPTGLAKKCTKCKKSKDLVEFPGDKYRKDGYSPWCKLCHRAAWRNYVARADSDNTGKAAS